MANTKSANFGVSTDQKSLSISSILGTVSDITFSLWIKLNAEIASGTWTLISMSTNGGGTNYVEWFIQYDYNGGTQRVRFIRSKPTGAADTITRTGALGTSSWYHFYMKHDGSTLRAGVNGAETGNTASSGYGANVGRNALFYIGADTSQGLTTGNGSVLIDDVRVYDTALADGTIWGFYTSPNELVGNEANLRAYYTFDSSLTADLTANAYTLSNNNAVTQSTDIPFPRNSTGSFLLNFI